MRIPRVLKYFLVGIASLVVLVGIMAGAFWIYFHPAHERKSGIVYGQRHGQDLILDVVRPAKPNGIGIVLLVSGGWKSGTNAFHPWMVAPLLQRGYTVLAACHISQPEASVMEITEDMHRAIRFTRLHAKEYGIDPERIGVTGGSAGGHLSLLLATRGGPGTSNATDPIDRESSAVQAVAIFYPVTDLLNLGKSTENLGDGGPPKSFVRAFGPESTNLAVWRVVGRDVSPIYFVNSNMPPILIYHGDADTLVPLDQSQRFQAKSRELGRTVELVVHPGGKHGWLSMVFDIRRFADWFDKYLRDRSG
jgi:acetyl esterase/lipase